MERHYDVLGVSPDAERAEVRRAYRELLKDHHPDQGGSRERFITIKRAYEEITGEVPPETGGFAGGPMVSTDVPAVDPTFEPDESVRGDGLTVRGDFLGVTLAGLVPGLELGSLVDDPSLNGNVRRSVAFFEVRNECTRLLPWRGRQRTSFIGDDGFMYEASSIVNPHADKLPGRWCGTDVDLRPGRALEAIVIAQEIPSDVTIEKIVYTQHAYGSDGRTVEQTERYLFELRESVRQSLAQVPFELDSAE